MKSGRSFMSIGEVLAALKGDFPDVTVSKIRFLEGEGLIEPERTASGYRKFHEKDLERLRFILTLQRDSYLPLKVIRERIESGDTTIDPPAALAEAAAAGASLAQADASEGASRSEHDHEDDLGEFPTALHLTESDLASAAGLDLGQVRALKEFGVICEHSMNGGAYYDQDDLYVGRIARDFIKYGLEPRHLKLFRRFADQEAALLQQVVTPALRNRSPEARKQAATSLGDLSRLSKKLRHAYLRQNLRRYLAGER